MATTIHRTDPLLGFGVALACMSNQGHLSEIMRAIPIVVGLMVPAVAIAPSVGPLADHVDVLGSLSLEESDSVLTVSVFVTPDPVGGFIVADPRDAQVRLYDERGRLRKLVAKPGLGPGEVRVPLSGLRRPDGRLLVVDVGTSNILEFDASGDAELGSTSSTRTP